MKQVILSIRPEWVEKILNGQKTIEIRKQKPNCEVPFKVYIYCTKGNNDLVYGQSHPLIPERYELVHGRSREESKNIYETLNQKIVAEFICDKILQLNTMGVNQNYDYCYESLNVFGNDDIEPYITSVKKSCVLKNDLNKYANRKTIYAWNISDLKIYEEPKELSQFYKYCGDKSNCEKCKYAYNDSNESIGSDEECLSEIEGCKPIVAAPQSYCFTEGELDGNT